jgi:tetratricopeptide (TPR) repeat protein
VNLGNAYLQDKQYTESEKAFKTAAKLDPQNPLADYTLGHQYANTDRLADAEAQFLKVQKISPNDGNVYYSLGMVYNKQEKYEEAATNLEKALTLKKRFPAANYELGVAYNGLGRTEDAQKQLAVLNTSDFNLASDLKFLLEKPRMIVMDTGKSGGFAEALGPGTPLWMLDPQMLTEKSSSKAFSVTFMFNNEMDLASVTNTQNWSISRANSTEAGYYNNTMPLSSKEAMLPATPEAVIYNAYTREATITFRLNQNATGDAVIDPSHVVFKFTGKDASGREMDVTANEMDGYAIFAF